MAAPAFGSIGTQQQGTVSTMAVDVPDSVAVDDIIVVAAFVIGTTTVTALPSGFAQAPDSPLLVDTVNHRLYVMWKRATAADSTAGTYDFTLSGSAYTNSAAARYTGAITTGDPWDVTNAAESGSVSDTVTPPVSDTTTVDDTLLVFVGDNWAGGTWTPPTGFTERRDSGDGVQTMADKTQAAAGATGSITATCTGSDRRGAWLGALKSATAVADTSAYTPARLPGLIGPDGWVFVTGARYDDTATVGTTAPAGLASGTGDAPQPNIALGVNAAASTGTGTAPQPVAAVRPAAAAASATGTAFPPTIAITTSAGVASATGSALQPVPAVKVNAGFAEATGTAPQPTVSTVPSTSAPAGLASGTGSALAPTIAITVQAAAPTATGTAPQPTVSISGSTNAPAGLAAATGTAFAPTIAVRALAGVASGSGAANPATVLTGDIGFAGLAAATGTALQPTIAIRVLAGVASAVGSAPQAVGLGDLPVERISDPLELTSLGQDLPLTAIDDHLTLEALEED